MREKAAGVIAAYYDQQGVTERFILNVLSVINAALGADFDVDTFQYVPVWDAPNTRMDLRLRSLCDQQVDIPGAGVTASFGVAVHLEGERSLDLFERAFMAEMRAKALGRDRVVVAPAP